jgi:hypothetical protein
LAVRCGFEAQTVSQALRARGPLPVARPDR